MLNPLINRETTNNKLNKNEYKKIIRLIYVMIVPGVYSVTLIVYLCVAWNKFLF